MVGIEHSALKKQILYLANHSPFYKRMFEKNAISTDSIQSIEDLQKIPFTEKEDLQNFTSDFICVPKSKLIDFVTTSGTTGKPVTLALTDSDLERLALNEYNSFKTAGVKEEDIIQLMTTIDRRFMAGLAYFLGARKLGAGIIRVGNGLPELQWDTIKEIKPTVIICVPSFILKLIEFAEENNIDFKKSSIKKAICIGESIRNADFSLNTLGEKITQKWNIQLHSTYASSEMATAFTECEMFQGGHLQSELIIPEIVDDNGFPAKEGEAGELVITTLGVEGMPLLRFKTGDICIAYSEPCGCGLESLRLSPVLGRKKQMIKYKGTSLYPNTIYSILDENELVKNYQVEVTNNSSGTDEIKIYIGINTDEMPLKTKLMDTFRAKLRVVPELVFLSPEKVTDLLLPDSSRKPLKFIDRRK
ncbi:phenylacetate--CoA ligase family protein [Aurantibacillus circumpalustris]|uniref:phenylacetate--CoA ligase family protein n=1 Tax=Aurantibacillus circumpalustris TaxID=3036359 RepID=UPI00295AD4CA|nr:AMP-binding protein [Aurantibacillus circumpalustris]